MRTKSLLLGATAMLIAAAPASAKGWYIGLEAGANILADSEVNIATTGGFTSNTTGHFDTGWALIATLGYSLQNWRVEGELALRSNDKDRFTILPVSTGDLYDVSGMFNMVYGIPFDEKLKFSFGGGAGFSYSNLDNDLVGDDDINFAYQAIATLDYELSPTIELTLAYRYLRVPDPEFERNAIALDFDAFETHALTVGVRYTYGD
jgi:opacity protein-like surface antigen